MQSFLKFERELQVSYNNYLVYIQCVPQGVSIGLLKCRDPTTPGWKRAQLVTVSEQDANYNECVFPPIRLMIVPIHRHVS